MVIMNHAPPPVANQALPKELIERLVAIVTGARAIEAWLVNSNRDSNSLELSFLIISMKYGR
jgi:hypothetical protein